MNNKNNNYRIMKFLEPTNKGDKSKGYVRLDMRGTKGMIVVSVENLGDGRSTSDVYLYKDKKNKIKVGTVNNKKGMIKKYISLGVNNGNIEDYNICGVVKENKIALYSSLFNNTAAYDVRKLEGSGSEDEVLEESGINMLNSDESNEGNENNEGNEAADEVNEAAEAEENNQDVNDENVSDAASDIADTYAEEEENTGGEETVADGYSVVEDSYGIEEEEGYQENSAGMEEQDAGTASSGDNVEAAAKKAQRNRFEENLYRVLNNYGKLEPLSVNINNLSWWKIPYDDRGVKNGTLPFYNQLISSYYPFPMSNRVTTCQNLIKKYGHYIFGIYKENNAIKRFVYGIPGEFKREEQPYKGVTGFKNWSYKNKNIDGNYGYWIAFVDSGTGEVTEPPQIDK